MKIVFAQLKKDILTQRLLLILWALCLASITIPIGIVVLSHHLPQHALAGFDMSNPRAFVGMVSVIGVFILCISAAFFGMLLLVPILVIRIVQEDPLMGTTAFWLTRPIPRVKLLLAKTLFIAILLLPLILPAGAGARLDNDKFWPAALAWIAAVAALASITPTVQSLLGYGAALFFGKKVFSGITNHLWAQYIGADSLFSDRISQKFSSAIKMLHLGSADLFHLCYLVGFSAVFIHQYLTLKARKSLAIFILTLLAIGLLEMLTGPQSGAAAQPSLKFNTTLQTP
jgi:hypothetical protein